MKKRFFPLLIAFSALTVSGSAAFYSVYGLSKLFAGASFQVMVMAGSLEFAKLVVASLLYQYWDTINKGLRAYLSIACLVLILITSGGIYGFLSGAYQSTANQSELLDKSLMILNQKQVRFEEQKVDLKIEKQNLNKSISDLRVALSNPAQVQYIDKESGTLITTSSSSARRALQSELKTATSSRGDINIKIEAAMDSINSTDMALLNKEVSNEAESELGPLKYLAETTGQDMGQVVNWFLLLIVFVFDPLAIALVIAANMAFAQIKSSSSIVKMSVPDGREFNKPYPILVEGMQQPAETENKVPIKLEEVDLVVDDLQQVNQGEPFQNVIDDILEESAEEDLEEFLETEDEDINVDVNDSSKLQESDTSEHELYHGDLKRDHTLSGNDKRRKKQGIRRRVRKINSQIKGNPSHNPNPYKG